MSEHRQDPFWLRWSFIEKIANNDLNKIALLIPVFGYLLLFNDSFVEALAFNRIAGVSDDQPSPFFLGPVTKLRFAFFGSLILLAANLLFKIFAPKELRQAKTEIAFSEIVVEAFSREEVNTLEKEVLAETWAFRTPILTSEQYAFTIRQREPRIQGLHPSAYRKLRDNDYLRLVAREYWMGKVHSYLVARILTLSLCLVGMAMLALPTLDITQAVIIDIVSG